MIKDGNDIEDPEDVYFNGSPSSEIIEEEEDESPPACIEHLLSAIFISRPLGILWDDDLIEEFLESLGYKIVERVDEDGEPYTVPVKPGSKLIPDRKDSLRRVFDREVQKTLLKWLIGINEDYE